MGTGGDQLATCDRAKSLVAERRMVGWLRRVVFSLFGPCRRIEESGVDNMILSLVRAGGIICLRIWCVGNPGARYSGEGWPNAGKAVLSSESGRSHTVSVKVNARVTVER
jgi:hypothetical protein